MINFQKQQTNNEIEERFIELLKAKTPEELEDEMLNSEPSGFGDIVFLCEWYREWYNTLHKNTDYVNNR